MVETDNFSSDWSELFDDIPDKTELVLSSYAKPAIAGAATSGDIPISSNFASTNKSSAKSGGSGATSNSQGSSNNGNKKRFPWWTLLILCLIFGGTASAIAGYNPVYRALRVVGIEGVAGKDGQDGADGIDGKDGINGISSLGTSTTGADGAAGQNGANGNDGAAGANGTNGSPGADGADGTDGTNACISGLCVSRQTTSPATQESGNINIDGKVLATQIGINDTTPSNTLTVGGTADISGHTSFGGAFAVDNASNPADVLIGATSHSTTSTIAEILTTMNSANRVYEGLNSQLILNPNSAPVYGQVYAMAGGVNIASGNTENFSGLLYGFSGGFTHQGSGTVSSGTGLNGSALNLYSGTVTEMTGLQSNIINYNPGSGGQGTVDSAIGVNVNFPVNAGTVTTYKGVNIKTPNNFGTVTNNYGLYIEDQSPVGSTLSYNLYSGGSTAKNYFAGLVSVGSTGTPGSVEKLRVGTPTTVDNLANTILSASASTSKGLVVQGAASQSANLQEWQDSTGTVLTRITSGGNIYTPAGSVIGLGSQYLWNSNGIKYNVDSGTAHAFFVGGSEAMRVDSTGNVGIGATSPGAKLDVNGNIDVGTANSTNYITFGTIDTGGGYNFIKSFGNEQRLGLNTVYQLDLAVVGAGAGDGLFLKADGSTTATVVSGSYGPHTAFAINQKVTGDIQQWQVNGTALAALDVNGNLGLGDTTPDARLDVSNTGTAGSVLQLTNSAGTCDHTPGAVSETVSCSSDQRLKTDITAAASVLSEINGLNVYDYTIISTGQKATGLIAQDLMQTHPEMVHMGEDGYYKVDSYNSWKLLKGIQELSSNADNLNATFTDALVKANGDITKTNDILSSLGLKVDTLSETMQELANRLYQVESSVSTQSNDIASLKAEIQALKQQLNSN